MSAHAKNSELVMLLFTLSGRPFQAFTVDPKYSDRCDMYDLDRCPYSNGVHYYMTSAGLSLSRLYAEINRGSYWIRPGLQAEGAEGLIRLASLPRDIPGALALFTIAHEGNDVFCSAKEIE